MDSIETTCKNRVRPLLVPTKISSIPYLKNKTEIIIFSMHENHVKYNELGLMII